MAQMLVLPDTKIYAGLYFTLCPLYCNTVLVNLNARQMIPKLDPVVYGSLLVWRDTESTDPIVVSGQSNGLDPERHELSLARVSRAF